MATTLVAPRPLLLRSAESQRQHRCRLCGLVTRGRRSQCWTMPLVLSSPVQSECRCYQTASTRTSRQHPERILTRCPFFPLFILKIVHRLYQDRLGTNTGKSHQKGCFLSASGVQPRATRLQYGYFRGVPRRCLLSTVHGQHTRRARCSRSVRRLRCAKTLF
jgi:hypothetical protein